MFINFWYCAGESKEFGSDPVQVRMLGFDFVIFRDSSSTLNCLSNICIHRGGNLAKGRITGDCIACPYHGWEFNGAGQCEKIPSLGNDGFFPARAQIDSYPVDEKYGLVFCFLGDLPERARPEIMDIPEFGKEGWRANLIVNQYRANFERGVENALDPAHNEFVHPTHGFSGERADYAVKQYDVVETADGAGFTLVFQSPKLTSNETMSKLRNFDGDLEAGSWYFGPNQILTTIHMSATNWFHQYSFRTPVDEVTTKSYLINMRNAMLDEKYDPTIRDRQYVIQEQDIVVLEGIEPSVPPHSTTRECLMPADKAIVHYRKYLQSLTAKGWRIDTQQIAVERTGRAFAIPSPARRMHKGWVIDEVPIVRGASTEPATV